MDGADGTTYNLSIIAISCSANLAGSAQEVGFDVLNSVHAVAELGEEIVKWWAAREAVVLASAVDRGGEDFHHVVASDSICTCDDGGEVLVCGLVGIGGKGVEHAFGAHQLGLGGHAVGLRAQEVSRRSGGLGSCT